MRNCIDEIKMQVKRVSKNLRRAGHENKSKLSKFDKTNQKEELKQILCD